MISPLKMLALLFLLFTPGLIAIDFENNGYKDVVVTIHPDVPETSGEDIINNIQVSIKQQQKAQIRYLININKLISVCS